MSKEKFQKIWNETKIAYTKIKEILSTTQTDSAPQYLSLTPIANADEDNVYSEMLKFALSQDKISNIAVTGPYGSGKSSVLLTFQMQNPTWKYLNISLATFKDHLEVEGASNKEIEIEAIEKSILQQLFYSVDQKTLPRSRLKRIVTVQTRELIANTLFIFIWTFLILFIFFPKSIFFDKFSILASSDQLAQTSISLLFLSYCIVGLFTGIKYIEKLKELKLKFQDTEITLNNDKVDSILNKHLDEILYFFERTDFNVIVIEDLDRFENSEIFIRLRELNTLINNSKQVNRPIVFLYAIRDNMFKDKDRSKFFDFIIPIIPVINPTNAYDLIRKNYISEKNDSQLHKEIEDVFLHQVSLYFDDMRLVTNIFNEFKFYVQKLQNPNLNKNKLLALIIYKNYYPAEFANLHSNKGEIYEIFTTRKKNIIANQLEQIKQEIITLDEEIQASQLEKIQTTTELRKLYIYEILKRYPQITRISNRYDYLQNIPYLVQLKADDTYLDQNNLTTDENFNIMQNSESIEWFVEITGNQPHTKIEIKNNQDITFTYKTIENIVNNTLSYKERETRIKNRETTNREKLLEQKQALVNKKNSLQLNTLKELLTRDISEEFFNSENHPPLLQFLIREGYIDEHYPDYISFFIDSVINITERDYAQRVINHINSEFDLTLTNIEKVLEKYLTPRQFSHTSILNFNLVDFILENSIQFKDHCKNLFILLSNQDERSIQFIFEYIDRGENLSLFINKIVKSWQNIFEHMHTSMTDEKVESYLLLILKNLEKENIPFLNKDDILKNYLSSKINFIEYIKDTYSSEQETISFLKILEPKFDYLECKNEEDRSLFNEICKNEYFEFNEKMILQIILLNNEDKNHNEIKNQFKLMPYSISMNFAPIYLKSQIENKINQYFEKILYTSTHKLNEYKHYFIDLINKLNLDDSHKIWLIENNEVQIDLISYIREAQFWKPILSENKVKPSWDSLISYYKHNDSTLDEVIFNYIDKNNELLKEQEISDSESKKSTPEITNEFEIALLESDSFSEIAYQAIVYARMFNYKSLDLSNLSNSKISLLISEKVLSLTSENTESLRKKSSSYIRDIIVRNSGDFLELIEEIILENHEYELLLQSSELTHEQKLIIVKKLGINFYQESNIQSIINQIFKANKLYIPVDYINSFFEKTSSSQTRLKLLISEISNLDNSNISTLLNMLDEPYRSIPNLGNHSLNYSDENENLINALKQIGYVNRVIIYEKKSILGLKSKSKINFMTKS